MDRRAFFRFARGQGPRTLDLSCEELYMRYLDATMRGEVERFVARLRRDLSGARLVRLRHTAWLGRDVQFQQIIATLLADVEAAGGRIERL